MKPCMQHVGHPKCHPAGRKAEETPIGDQNASRKVTGGAKITEHPSKTWGKAWKSTELPSSFVQVSKCHSLADRRQQECQRKSRFGFLILPESCSLSPARDPQVNQTHIRCLQSQA